jgi:small GTP-binding protein
MGKYLYKIVVGGEGGVGKTSFLVRAIKGEFSKNQKMTIGVDFHLKEIQYDGSSYTFQIWDLGGQKRFEFMHDSYLKNTKIGIVMFDVQRMDTFILLNKWERILRKRNESLPILLIGNKIDLPRVVSDKEIEQKCENLRFFDYIKTSCKDNINIGEVFQRMVKELRGENEACVDEKGSEVCKELTNT